MSNESHTPIFGVFIPQGWKMELAGITGAAEQWKTAVDVAVLPVGLARGPRLGAQPLFWAQGADLADGRPVLAARDRGGLGLG